MALNLGLTFYQDDVFGDTVLEFTADPGSSLIYTVEAPVFAGVSAYAIQTEIGSAWSDPVYCPARRRVGVSRACRRRGFEPGCVWKPCCGVWNLAIGLGSVSGGQERCHVCRSRPDTEPATVGVYRFFDTLDGTHFFTANSSERDQLLATRPDLAFEGVGIDAVFRFLGRSECRGGVSILQHD